jgi:hypothetical protein
VPQKNCANRHLSRYELFNAMNQPRRIFFAVTGGALLTGALLVPLSSQGQSDLLPPPNLLQPAQPARPAAPALPAAQPAPQDRAADDTAVATLIAEVVQQQAKLAENQKLIDEKLALIAENLRIARIYVSRAK